MNSGKTWIWGLGLVGAILLSGPVVIAHIYQKGLDRELAISEEKISGGDREMRSESAKEVPVNVKRGEVAFNRNCAMCHQVGGTGKPGLAPSIRNPDFLALASDEFIRETIREGREETAMIPRPELPKEDVENIIAYLRAVEGDDRRLVVLDHERRFGGNAEAGKGKYAAYCSPCHGPKGKGYAEGFEGPGIGLPGFLNTASDDYILHTAMRGRVGTAMRSMVGHRGLANLKEEDVHDIIVHLRQQNPAAQADYAASMGEKLFERNCAVCHQPGGQGKSGLAPSIGNRDFLALASDDFIKQTVRQGRVNTAMLPQRNLADYQLDQIIAYLRSLSVGSIPDIRVDPDRKYHGDPTEGGRNFALYCAACHGPNGEGYLAGGAGPGIGQPGFLGTVSDDFIFKTVQYGRTGTAMRSFIGARGLVNLQEEEVHDIIAFLRSR